MTSYHLFNLSGELHAGDYPTELIVTIYDIRRVDGELVQEPMDLDGLTVKLLLCGENHVVELDTQIVGPSTEGTVRAYTEEGNLKEGSLIIRARVSGGGGTWHTSAVETLVNPVC